VQRSGDAARSEAKLLGGRTQAALRTRAKPVLNLLSVEDRSLAAAEIEKQAA